MCELNNKMFSTLITTSPKTDNKLKKLTAKNNKGEQDLEYRGK